MFDPPKSPRGPGWTDGEMNNAFIPSSVLKLMKVTTVSMASLIFSNRPSKEFDPSFICAINKLNKSRTPIPRFFLNGEAITMMNAYIARTNIIPAIIAFRVICKITGPIKLVSAPKNVIKVYIAKINNG